MQFFYCCSAHLHHLLFDLHQCLVGTFCLLTLYSGLLAYQ